MKIPLDYICLKSGVLCPRCRRLIEEGKVGEHEVEVMKVLIDLEEKDPEFKFLRDAVYVKTYTSNGFHVLVLKIPEDIPPTTLIRLSRVLSDRLNAKVRVVKQTNDMKYMIAQIVAPARVQGVNSLWLPDGTVQHIVRIPRYDARLLPTAIENIEKILKEMFGENIRVKLS